MMLFTAALASSALYPNASMTRGKFSSVSRRLMPVLMPLISLPPSCVAKLPTMVPMALPLRTSLKLREKLFPALVPTSPSAPFTAPVNLLISGMMVM